MNISQINLYKLKIPLKQPFITALRRTEFVEDIIVTIQGSDGLIGYGSAAATPAITGDTHESIIEIIKNLFAPYLLGQSIETFETLLLRIQNSIDKNTSAKAAVDIALHDLITKYQKIPLYQFLDGKNTILKTVNTISAKDEESMLADAQLFVKQGFETLKIKVGLNPPQDIETLKAIRNVIGDKIKIICDANQGWDVTFSMNALKNLYESGIDITMLEQPVKAADYTSLKMIHEQSPIPIFADESVFNLADAKKIIDENIAGGINIKLMKSGGLHQAKSIYDLATQNHLLCMVGCMLESPVALTAMASFAMGRNNIQWIDLDPISMIKNNPVSGGIQIDGPNIYLADAPGLGIDSISDLEFITTLT